MKVVRTIILVLAVITGLILVTQITPWIGATGTPQVAQSVGIIGGADGPTAIFVAQGLASSPYLMGAVFLVLLATWAILKKRSKR